VVVGLCREAAQHHSPGLQPSALGKATNEIALKVATEGGSGRSTFGCIMRADIGCHFQGTFPAN
jgi:hypothetical protein